jgi:hypothetical protein
MLYSSVIEWNPIKNIKAKAPEISKLFQSAIIALTVRWVRSAECGGCQSGVAKVFLLLNLT